MSHGLPIRAALSTLFALTAALGALGCSYQPSGDASANVGEAKQALGSNWPTDHLATAQQWLTDIQPANNFYDSPVGVYYSGGTLYATSECGSYTAQLLMQSYTAITSGVLQTYFCSSSPEAYQWYNGIDPAVTHPCSPDGGTLSGPPWLLPLDSSLGSPTGRTMRSGSTTFLAQGDIMAAKYTSGSASGHVMTVATITAPSATRSQTGIPGVTTVYRWQVHIYDSTESVHNSTDSRYQNDPSEADGNDHGIGAGNLYLYEDATTGNATVGQLVGWTWSTSSSTPYQMTSSSSSNYRPMVIGRFSL